MADREFDRDPQWWNRDYYSERRFSPYNRGYDPDYDYDYPDYGYDYWGTPYNGWVNGPYTGVGPRNYRRSDERIQDDINDLLTWHGHIDAREINVSVDDGVVTFEGTVDSRREKRMVEDVADSVSGVWDVNNNLNIRRLEGGTETRTAAGAGTTRQMREGQIREGMEVVGRNNGRVGQVKEVRANDFLVDRSMARDVYVPSSAASMMDGRLRLNVRADEVDNQGWETPELVETS